MPVKPISDCANIVNHPIINFEDSDPDCKAVYQLKNTNRIGVNKVDVEYCVLSDRDIVGKKCDWLSQFSINDKLYTVLIELKGSNVDEGVEQLLETFNKLENQLRQHIVSSRLSYSNSKGQRGLRDEDFKRLITKLSNHNRRIHPRQYKREYLFEYSRTTYSENISDFQI